MRKILRHGRRPLRVIAAVAVFFFLALLALAASPELHRLIHADAGVPQHHCAITVLAQGQFDAPVDHVLVAAPVSPAEPPACATTFVFAETLRLLPPGRAPPSAS